MNGLFGALKAISLIDIEGKLGLKLDFNFTTY